MESIEANTVARLLTVSGINSAKAVPPAEMFTPHPTKENFSLPTMPDSYPGCVVSLNDDETEPASIPGNDGAIKQRFGAAAMCWRVPVYVALYATSDGTTQTGARFLAWQLSELVIKSLMKFRPADASTQAAGTSMWPLEPEKIEPILVDANTHGMLMKFGAIYQIQQIG